MLCFFTRALLLLPLAFTALAQAPTVTNSTPAHNAINGSRTAPIQMQFSQAVAAPANAVWLTSSSSGRRAVTISSNSATQQLIVQPTAPLLAGEQVQVSLSTAVNGPGGPLSAPYAFEFWTATQHSTGPLAFQNLTPTGWDNILLAADLDADGDLDLLGSAGTRLDYFLNNGNGQFTLTTGRLPGLSGYVRAITDMDHDGDVDLILTPQFLDTHALQIGLNNGSGTFSAGPQSFVSEDFSEVIIADFNGDGFPDFAGDAGYDSGQLSFSPFVRLNDGSGHFGGSGFLPTAGTTRAYYGLRAADFDGDGLPDLLQTGEQDFAFFRNTGGGNFAPPVLSRNINFSTVASIVVGDFDGDGDLDIFNGLNRGIKLVQNDGSGQFTITTVGNPLPIGTPLTGSQRSLARAGDMDGDGDLDVVQMGDSAGGFGVLYVLRNNGFGTQFTPTDRRRITQPYWMTLGDYNNDGALDVGVSLQGSNIVGLRTGILTATPDATPDQHPLQLWPNPARGTVRLDGLPPGAEAVQVLDALGRTVLVSHLAPGTAHLELPLTGLAPGVYTVRVGTAARRLVVE